MRQAPSISCTFFNLKFFCGNNVYIYFVREKMMKHYKKWNQLTASILFILGAAMVGNSFSVYANNAIVHHDRITGKYNVDRAKFRKSSGITIKRITHEDDFGTKYTDATSYNFGGRDHIFHVRDNDGITTS